MTAQEAIELIKSTPLYRYENNRFHGEVSELYHALVMVVHALEKQIPKNAVVLDKIYDEVRSCPTCGKDTVFHGRTFWCCRCGQLLRWE